MSARYRHTTSRAEGRAPLTGIPLEQLIPAPVITTAFLHFAIAVETSDNALRAEKSFLLVDVRSVSRGRVVIVILLAFLQGINPDPRQMGDRVLCSNEAAVDTGCRSSVSGDDCRRRCVG
jgi:hypothetical protein